ncbi:NO-inducible flavohemoprotein [Rummeliibacillus pycnus]|uniref:NO-inducible flavohemoprotein n=1 Tax=Rummeliibacillus pycnus TaxID=101070 RepID=UPI003D26A14C
MLSQKTMDIIKSTAPVLEKYGQEITTVFYKRLFESHPELLNIFNQTNQRKGRQQMALANTVYAAAVHIENLSEIIPVVKGIAEKHRSLGIKPEHYPIVGENLLIAIKEVLGDAATDEIMNAWTEAYGVLADIFISTEEALYQEAENKQGGWRLFKDYQLVDKVPENKLVTSFYLKPVDGAPLPDYKPGQYITVHVTIPGEKYTHNRQYSLSKAYDGESYRISVKREVVNEPFGIVSNYLHEHFNVGDILPISAPAGTFFYHSKPNTPVTFLAGGIGITPLMSMLQVAVKEEHTTSINFVQSVNNADLVVFGKNLNDLKQQQSNLNYFEFITETDGFVSKEFLEEHVEKSSEVYLCGPVPFMMAMINHLISIGVSKDHIYYEFFGPSMALDIKS